MLASGHGEQAGGDLLTAARAALASVLDPCSRMNGNGLSLDDLGMIEKLDATSDGRVMVWLLLDDPGCAYLSVINHEIREALSEVPGVQAVRVELVSDVLWTPERMLTLVPSTAAPDRSATAGGNCCEAADQAPVSSGASTAAERRLG